VALIVDKAIGLSRIAFADRQHAIRSNSKGTAVEVDRAVGECQREIGVVALIVCCSTIRNCCNPLFAEFRDFESAAFVDSECLKLEMVCCVKVEYRLQGAVQYGSIDLKEAGIVETAVNSQRSKIDFAGIRCSPFEGNVLITRKRAFDICLAGDNGCIRNFSCLTFVNDDRANRTGISLICSCSFISSDCGASHQGGNSGSNDGLHRLALIGRSLFARHDDAACKRLGNFECTIHYSITPRVFLHLVSPTFAGCEAVQTALRAVYEVV